VRLVQMAFFFYDIPIRMEGPTYIVILSIMYVGGGVGQLDAGEA